MKNKVDIGKLIEKKYKANTLELNDILEQIDLVLQETVDYKYNSKIDTGNLEETDPGNARSIAYHNGAPIDPSNPNIGAPRQEIPGNLARDAQVLSQVRPDKIAEVSQEPDSVTVPDLFSTITNSSLEIKDDDRQIINEIVSSFGSSSEDWSEKIKSIQNFIIQNTSDSQFSGDLREAIAKLIYLNLFKKISYFTAQPGKLFEYIIAPIIGPDSKVVGKDDQDIIDIDSANANGYSIKLFTGEASGQVVQGSIERLRDVTEKEPVQYIIAVVDKNSKTISFVEFAISLNPSHFNGWKELNKTKEGVILSKLEKDITKYGILVTLTGYTPEQFAKDVVQVLGTNIKTVEIQSKIDSIQQFLQNSDKNVKDLKNIVIEPFREIKEIVKLRIAAELPDSDKSLSVKNIFALNQKKPKYFENLISYILKELEKIKQQQASLNEATEEDTASEAGKFKIPIKGSWKNLSSISLELGDPKVYNQFQLKIASEVQKTMVNVLNSFSSLGKNMTLYFGTTTHKQMTRRKEMTTYAQDCVNDANKIVSGIKEIATSEGENIK